MSRSTSSPSPTCLRDSGSSSASTAIPSPPLTVGAPATWRSSPRSCAPGWSSCGARPSCQLLLEHVQRARARVGVAPALLEIEQAHDLGAQAGIDVGDEARHRRQDEVEAEAGAAVRLRGARAAALLT